VTATEQERPLTVAVFGASVTALVTGPRQPGATFLTYPQVLAEQEVDGRGFDVATDARIYGLVRDFTGIWMRPLAVTRPDVVVLQFGLGETFPRIVPRRLVMHLLGITRHSSPLRDAYWRRARRALMAIHAIERRVDPLLPTRWSRLPYRRFESELSLVCDKIREQVGSRLVLMTAYPATAPTPFLNPKMLARLELDNAAIQRVAAAHDATVFPLDDVVADQGPGALPDGLHMSVGTHRAVGERLATCIARVAVPQAS
jgi:lysophospholipase L1-like esterase